MLRKLLFLVLVVALGFLCADAKRRRLPGGKRVSCATFGRRGSNRTICITQHKSGKFSISVGNRGENDPKTVTFGFDAIREIDENGEIIGKTGPKDSKHSFENFAALDFEFSDLENKTYQNIDAFGFEFNATIPGSNASLNVPVYIFKENGTIDLCGDEEIDIVRGMVKYNIELSNWGFCGDGSECKKGNKNEIGKFVDFVISVKNPGGKAIKGKKGLKKPGSKKIKARKFFFGKNSVSFPSDVNSDGKCGVMAEDYPKLGKTGSMNTVTFRFPKFSDKVIYDPSVALEVEVEDPDTDPDDSGVKLLYPSFGLVMILGFLARLFF